MVRPEVKKKRQELALKKVQSRKATKKLEKVVLRRKSKVDRQHLLTQLKECQLHPDQLDLIHSTSSMQTKGLRKFIHSQEDSATNKPGHDDVERAERCLNAAQLIKIRKRRRRNQSKLNVQKSTSSSSEDTDDVSTDESSGENDIESKQQEQENRLTPPFMDSQQDVAKQGTIDPNDENLTNSKNEVGSVSAIKLENRLRPKDVPDNHPKKPQEPRQPAVYVPVVRKPEIEEARLKLPIIGEEQQIMEMIRYNDIVVVSGETGSGKTTQIPQFLYEAGYALDGKMIGITEPRRVAAVSMSERVARELNLSSDEVSYQIRFSGSVSERTKIKFMTDGVMMREIQKDPLMSKYSVIIIDEAHERSVYSDILIGLLSRFVRLRSKRSDPLKLVIMSATLRVSDFTENSHLFREPPPVINIETRQYTVEMQFAKKTPANYLVAAYKKVCSVHSKMPQGGILVFVTSQADVRLLCKKLNHKFKPKSLRCLGLFAMLPLEKQRLVFTKPPEGTRLCVIATNVAETSITIPNIKYVIDTGMEKKKVYDLVTGISKFVTTWTSKSSAEQRMGRAGRMGPGHCFRLYSSAVFVNDFPDHAEPHILQKPVEDVLLQMKTMNIDNVVNFPFPTRPSMDALKAAEKKLILLGALDDSKFRLALHKDMLKTEYASKPTALGEAMARFAVGARCSRMMVLAPPELIHHVIALVSALTVREMFLEGNRWRPIRKKWLGHGDLKMLGDYMIMLRAVMKSESSGCSEKLCLENGLRTKAMLEIDKLRRQLTKEAKVNLNYNIVQQGKLKKPTLAQSRLLRQLILGSYPDRVARKKARDEKDSKNAYKDEETGRTVYIGSDSILKGVNPDIVIYKELYKGAEKTYMRDIAVVDPEWMN